MGIIAEIGILLGFFLKKKTMLKLEDSLSSLISSCFPGQVNCSVPKDACLFLEGL